MTTDKRITESGGNVFADPGAPDAGELLAKADLAIEIGHLFDERGLSQAAAAKLLRTSQPRISDLRRGKLEGFTLHRLVRFLNALGQDVELSIQPKRMADARVVVTAREAAWSRLFVESDPIRAANVRRRVGSVRRPG